MKLGLFESWMPEVDVQAGQIGRWILHAPWTRDSSLRSIVDVKHNW